MTAVAVLRREVAVFWGVAVGSSIVRRYSVTSPEANRGRESGRRRASAPIGEPGPSDLVVDECRQIFGTLEYR
jgi:hypothetical protein